MNSIPSMTVNEAAEIVARNEPDVVLLDVREDEEWRFGHAPTATHLAMSKIQARVGDLDRSKRYLCVCRSGNRSGQVTAFLNNQGFDATNVSGGMNAWSSFGHEVVAFDGRPGTVV